MYISFEQRYSTIPSTSLLASSITLAAKSLLAILNNLACSVMHMQVFCLTPPRNISRSPKISRSPTTQTLYFFGFVNFSLSLLSQSFRCFCGMAFQSLNSPLFTTYIQSTGSPSIQSLWPIFTSFWSIRYKRLSKLVLLIFVNSSISSIKTYFALITLIMVYLTIISQSLFLISKNSQLVMAKVLTALLALSLRVLSPNTSPTGNLTTSLTPSLTTSSPLSFCVTTLSGICTLTSPAITTKNLSAESPIQQTQFPPATSLQQRCRQTYNKAFSPLSLRIDWKYWKVTQQRIRMQLSREVRRLTFFVRIIRRVRDCCREVSREFMRRSMVQKGMFWLTRLRINQASRMRQGSLFINIINYSLKNDPKLQIYIISHKNVEQSPTKSATRFGPMVPDHLPTITIMFPILTALPTQAAQSRPTQRQQQYRPDPRSAPNLRYDIRYDNLLAARTDDLRGEGGEVGVLGELLFLVGRGWVQEEPGGFGERVARYYVGGGDGGVVVVGGRGAGGREEQD